MKALVPTEQPKKREPDEKKQLTEKQEAFAVAYVTNGGNATQAAKDAGYSDDAARVLGPRNLRNPLIQQRIYQLAVEEIAVSVPQALGTMRKLLGARSEFVRFNAASDLLNRGGLKPADRHLHHVQGEIKVSIDLGE